MTTERADRLYPLLAFLLAALVPLLACPFENAPFNDDFSYARMARQVAETGRYTLDGWTAPIAGPLAYYGAAFIRLFGPSHVTLRFATLLLAGGAALLLYRIARAATLSPGLALQATLICMLCPVAIPLSASFMTDIPALFLAALAIVLAIAATEGARPPLARSLCFAGMLLAGFLGGTVRQTNWALVAFVAPLLIALAPISRGLRGIWAALWLATCGAVLLAMKRHAETPYALPEHLSHLLAGLARITLFRYEFQTVRSLHSFLFMALPALAALLPLARRLSPRTLTLAALLLASFASLVHYQGFLELVLDPCLGNMVTQFGIMLPNDDMPGHKPLAFPLPLLFSFALLRWLLLALAVALLAEQLARHRRSLRPALASLVGNRPLLYLALFALLTAGLSMLRIYTIFGFDRYFLPALPFAVVSMLLLRQRWISPRPSRAAWALCGLLALAGVAFTFDYHQLLAARLKAVALLTARGIQRDQISAGFELDAEAHLAARGYINSPTLKIPAGAFQPRVPNPLWPAPKEDYFWFWPYTPSITPRYLLARSLHPGYDPKPVGMVDAPRLLPPGRQRVFIQQLPAGHQHLSPYLP